MSKRLALAGFLLLLATPSITRAHPAVSVVMDRQGNVFYSDLSQVWIVRPNGVKSIAVPNVHSHELYVDAAGNLYGEHLWHEGVRNRKWGHRVWKRAPDGTISDVIPTTSGFRTDYSFVRDTLGSMYYVQSHQVMKRSGSGERTVFSGGPFAGVRSMAAARDGSIYLVDDGDLKHVGADGRIRVVAPGLASRSLRRLNVGKQHAVMGVWLDSAQNVYAARYGAGDVKRITPSGEIATVASSPLLWGPTGGLVTPGGDLFVLESSVINEVRLKRISKDGTVRYY